MVEKGWGNKSLLIANSITVEDIFPDYRKKIVRKTKPEGIKY